MSNGKLLRQLIRSGAEGDLDAFRGVAKQVITEERQKQHHLLANDLETILYGRSQTPSSPALRNLTATIPEDRERGIPLLSVRERFRSMAEGMIRPGQGVRGPGKANRNGTIILLCLRSHRRKGMPPGPPGAGRQEDETS